MNLHNNTTRFLALTPEEASYERARIAVLPIPYEATVSYGRGTSKGPAAIIEATEQVEWFDEQFGFESLDIGVAALQSLKVEGTRPSELGKVIAPAVRQIVRDGKIPLSLGGEHSITPHIVNAVREFHDDITVVQIDAHADLREEYHGEKFSHACAMARVREMCPVVHIGIRNISKQEFELAERERLPIFYAYKIHGSNTWVKDAIAAIGTKRVYLSIDIDGFDSSIMPATGTPEPGGLGWYQVMDLLSSLYKSKDVVGADIVELAPIEGLHACDFLAAKLLYKMIGFWKK